MNRGNKLEAWYSFGLEGTHGLEYSLYKTETGESISALVLGHTGFLGSRVFNALKMNGIEVIGVSKTSGMDLRIPNVLDEVIIESRCNLIINCAAIVGGIEFSTLHQVDLFRENLLMTMSILDSAARHKVKLINPISNCVYPRDLTVFSEAELWNGPLDESVLVYGSIRKLGWVGSWAYSKQLGLNSTNLIFPNLYGPGDHLDPVRAHALGGIVFRLINALRNNDPEFVVWGSGNPVREWMYIDDACNAIMLAMGIKTDVYPINVGTGIGISIKELTYEIAKQLGYLGNISFDTSKIDGAPYKTMDGSRGAELLKWEQQVDFISGIGQTVNWYKENMKNA